MTIGVMLTAYKRTHLLERQVAAIRAQTVKPDKVWLFDNSGVDECCAFEAHRPRLYGSDSIDTIIAATTNLGVWARFMLAPLLGTDYIAVFDDDTIPGPRWFENCIKTLEELKRQGVPGALLGSCGVTFAEGNREQRVYLGWKHPSEQAMQADIVGHAWFFEASLLGSFSPGKLAAEFPTCGEDYWLSATAQQLEWPTVCPPHPQDNKDWWGSIEGMELGSDDHALWRQPEEVDRKAKFHDMVAKTMRFDAVRFKDDGIEGTCWNMPHVAEQSADDVMLSPEYLAIGVPQLWGIRKLGITPKFMLDCGPGLPGGEAWQASKLWPGITIIGFEPQPDRFMALKKADYPGLLTPYAVAEVCADSCVTHVGENLNAGFFKASTSDGRSWDCTSLRLDDVIALRPDLADGGLLWMDIEGAEKLALQGATETLRRCVAVVTEMWPTPREPGWCKDSDVAAILSGAGFRKAAEFPSLGNGDMQRDELWVK